MRDVLLLMASMPQSSNIYEHFIFLKTSLVCICYKNERVHFDGYNNILRKIIQLNDFTDNSETYVRQNDDSD